MNTPPNSGPIINPTRANKTLGGPSRQSLGGAMLVAALMLCPTFVGATDAAPVSAETTVTQLMTRDLIGAPGKEVLMITVTYLPGGASLPHRHDPQVFVYVLQGEITMQL